MAEDSLWKRALWMAAFSAAFTSATRLCAANAPGTEARGDMSSGLVNPPPTRRRRLLPLPASTSGCLLLFVEDTEDDSPEKYCTKGATRKPEVAVVSVPCLPCGGIGERVASTSIFSTAGVDNSFTEEELFTLLDIVERREVRLTRRAELASVSRACEGVVDPLSALNDEDIEATEEPMEITLELSKDARKRARVTGRLPLGGTYGAEDFPPSESRPFALMILPDVADKAFENESDGRGSTLIDVFFCGILTKSLVR